MDVFTPVKDSDTPVPLLSRPTVVHVDGFVTHSLWPEAHSGLSEGANHAESEWKACARQIKQQAGAQGRSKWPTKQLVPLVLDRVVQTGGVQVVVVLVVGAE